MCLNSDDSSNKQAGSRSSAKAAAEHARRVFLDGIRKSYTPAQIRELQGLHEDAIESLINRFPDSPPPWVHRAVDSLLTLNEALQEMN